MASPSGSVLFVHLNSTVVPNPDVPSEGRSRVGAVGGWFVLGGIVPAQAPLEQTSPVVKGFPSLQGNVLKVCTQPVTVSQESVVHTLLSLQFIGV